MHNALRTCALITILSLTLECNGETCVFMPVTLEKLKGHIALDLSVRASVQNVR